MVAISELVSSGAGVLAVCADASRRAALATGAAGLARFNGGSGRVACSRCGPQALAELRAKAAGGLALTDYGALEAAGEEGAELVAEFEHVVLVDPPTDPAAAALVAAGEAGYLHELWSEAEHEFALAALDEALASRAAVAAVYRGLREACQGAANGASKPAEIAGEALRDGVPEPVGISGEALRDALRGSVRSPARARGRRSCLPRPAGARFGHWGAKWRSRLGLRSILRGNRTGALTGVPEL